MRVRAREEAAGERPQTSKKLHNLFVQFFAGQQTSSRAAQKTSRGRNAPKRPTTGRPSPPRRERKARSRSEPPGGGPAEGRPSAQATRSGGGHSAAGEGPGEHAADQAEGKGKERSAVAPARRKGGVAARSGSLAQSKDGATHRSDGQGRGGGRRQGRERGGRPTEAAADGWPNKDGPQAAAGRREAAQEQAADRTASRHTENAVWGRKKRPQTASGSDPALLQGWIGPTRQSANTVAKGGIAHYGVIPPLSIFCHEHVSTR